MTNVGSRQIVSAQEDLKDAARPLWQEAKELHLIFAKIHRSRGEPADKNSSLRIRH